MRSTWKLEVLIAALVVLMAAPLLLAGGTGTTSEKVTVVSGTDVQELTLDDLKDGETKTIKGPKGDITITRDGDVLRVKLSGEELLVTPGKDNHAFIMSTGDGPGGKVGRWVTVSSGDEEEHDVETFVVRSADGSKVDVKSLPLWVGTNDRVLYRCPKDGAELAVPEKDATMEAFTCPICGTAMEKLDDGAKVHKRVIVKVEEDKETPEK